MKWIKPIFIIGITAAFAVTILWFFLHGGPTDAETIRKNWKIDLTGESEDVYYKDTGPSFHGDGPRITIMKYPDFYAVRKAVSWKDGPSKEVESKVSEILTSELKVEAKYRPNFKTEYKYYFYKKDWLNTICLIYKPSENCLYAVEDLY
ncbi:MAG TPA: hypothetical protein VHR42_06665 [Clostridia bacterium]|nr:hypothetical protein [Clostridia bacterium]